jgi:hypothetical protein
MSFSDLVHRVEHIADDVLVPEDRPSSVQEAMAMAKKAEGVAVTLDPELEPIFAAIGAVGNDIERALSDLGHHVGNLKATLAGRAAAPVAPVLPAGAAPVGVPDPAAPQPAATGPQPSTTDLQRAADEAALARQAPPEATDPNPLPAAADASAPAPAGAVLTEATPLPAPGTADPAGANPPEPELPAVATPSADDLAEAEADFSSLSPEDRATFEKDEALEQIPPA